ncbi:MAG: carbohydrate ABC transporter permease [Candidatus Rokubacteria bacterium]|nr:carbohydrate ABC transporter permease [Candidatus Rokubacteria bacterium]
MTGVTGPGRPDILVLADGHGQHSRCVALRPLVLKRIGRLLLYVVLMGGAVVMVSPFMWMLSTSVTPAAEVFAWPPRLIPSALRVDNYREALVKLDFSRYFINSLIVAGVSTLSVLILDSLAGYAFARLRFPGRGVLFSFILGTVMIPVQVTMIPLFIMFRAVPLAGGNDLLGTGGTGLIDTYSALIFPGMATTLGVYIMREFFSMLPPDLLDAARIDGCSEFQAFCRVYLPLAKPALATVGMFTFTESWNAFLWPLILTTKPEMRTLQLGLSSYKDQYFADWHLLMAAAVITSLPIFLIFLVGQRQFIKGVALSGLKA